MTIIFPGQGSQHVGMGAALFAQFPQETAQASAILGYDLAALCRDNPDGKLSQTQYTQPALFVVSALAWLARGAPPTAFFAGHSLGEITALWAAGAIDFATGVRLVQKRGELMARVGGGGMAAVIGLTPAQVRRAVEGSALDVANYNAYDQTVIAGPKAELAAAGARLRGAGARHVVELDVSAPFHSRYMKPTEDELARFLDTLAFSPPHTPVVANATALPYAADALRETLLRQVSGSVRWIESVEYLIRRGEREFVEVGPGAVLTRLIQNIRQSTAFAN
ncbi:ACP S-malonyltransferase [Massilia sp. DJPM01]|uniref:ACP S-malonyltransferase n=1 Tax=Massilia sp. DJPM01 TaxID=3024404 RepID=UPI00259E86D2|nr:ACP S-malonyltransferase [Massilia sp. DJPM01]MDM5177608.1 ACP S-malonyltransferase [Massilia sp. DJPM01]